MVVGFGTGAPTMGVHELALMRNLSFVFLCVFLFFFFFFVLLFADELECSSDASDWEESSWML